jgi:hypothetical protein
VYQIAWVDCWESTTVETVKPCFRLFGTRHDHVGLVGLSGTATRRDSLCTDVSEAPRLELSWPVRKRMLLQSSIGVPLSRNDALELSLRLT